MPPLHPRRLALAAAAGLALGLLATPAVAAVGAAPDTTAPTVALEPLARYRAGSSAFINIGPNNSVQYWEMPMLVRWTASDASGICKQTVTEQSYDTLGGNPDPILGRDTVTQRVPKAARTFPFATNTFDEERVPSRFVVRVTDCAGNTTASSIAGVQVAISDDDARMVGYTGAWAVSHFKGFAGRTTTFTSIRGAAVSFTDDGGPVAVVMEKAANRGSAQIFVDGSLAATVDTFSAATQHQAIVWEASLSNGSHTIKVVNLATPGHPRIDVDAILR